jgi:hydrogenase maturation factor
MPDLPHLNIDDLYDVAILSHGFMPYKRDYYFHIETLWSEPLAGQYILTFRHCYEMSYVANTESKTLLDSWDDCFINMEDYEKAGEPSGYVWGTNWADA